jgi:hypothetical protein
VLLASLAHIYLAKRMNVNKSLEAGLSSPLLRMALIVAVPLVFHSIGQYLAQLSGWHIDIPQMLGFDHRIPGGFRLGVYGF